MPLRSASAVWEGDLKSGKGSMRLGSGSYEGAYSFASRFQDGTGTNPEELIGAAHAGCFSMALSAGLAAAGFPPRRVQTEARVHLEKDGEAFKIGRIELHAEADVPGMDAAAFQQQAETAKKNCPVSKALAGVRIDLQARLK